MSTERFRKQCCVEDCHCKDTDVMITTMEDPETPKFYCLFHAITALLLKVDSSTSLMLIGTFVKGLRKEHPSVTRSPGEELEQALQFRRKLDGETP